MKFREKMKFRFFNKKKYFFFFFFEKDFKNKIKFFCLKKVFICFIC